MPTSRPMTFRRFGRSRHLKITRAEDLAGVGELNEAHWVATGAPVDTLNCDRTFLDLVDGDHNGRLICSEITNAVQWLLGVLRDTSGVTASSATLALSAINTDTEQGRRIYDSAAKMLQQTGPHDREKTPDADSPAITLDQVRRIKADVQAAPVSEAGVVLPQASGDDDVRQFLTDIIATVGSATHPSGADGVARAQLDDFLDQARAHLDWLDAAATTPDTSGEPIMPLGERTPQAFAIYAELRDKVDLYFAQCEAVAFEPLSAAYVKPARADLEALDLSDPKSIDVFIAQAPLAKPGADKLLSFEGPINPHYADLLAKLRVEVIAPALGEAVDTISSEQWRRVKDFFAAHAAWLSAKAGEAVSPLGVDTLKRYLDPRFRQAADTLIAESTETAFVMDNIRLTEKLILFQAYMLPLANNFVSFPHLYDPASRAMFEMGTLVMDGRRFNFCVKAGDLAAHAAVAAGGNMFVLYAEITPPADAAKYEIAAAVTSGGKGNLCVGKRGLFLDVSGRQADARVVRIIENPISIGEAVLSPFRRLGRMLSGKIEAIATSAQKEFDTRASGVIEGGQKGKEPAPAPSANRGLLAGGLLMGGGVALAALGSAFTYAVTTFQDVPAWKIALAIAVAILAVVLPVSAIGLTKLLKRDLSAILEGSGWAINARMRLSLRQGRFFTQRPSYPLQSDLPIPRRSDPE